MREVPRALIGNTVSVPAIQQPGAVRVLESERHRRPRPAFSRDGDDAHRVAPAGRAAASVVRQRRPTQAALATLDRVGSVATYQPSTGVVYPANDGLAQAFRAVAGAMVRGIGTKVFWVQTGGYDTHATQNTNAANAGYANLMGTLNTALTTFYNDLRNQGCCRTR